MTIVVLLRRSLAYYWRTNVAVVLGVATAVAVLAGALVVGDSVRGSLRDLVLHRLGRTTHVVSAAGFFREELAADLAGRPWFRAAFDAACPIVLLDGLVTHEETRRVASGVRIFGVDDRFWRFHGVAPPDGLGPSDALVSPALAAELATTAGDSLLVRVEKPSEVPAGFLHGQRDNLARTIRLSARPMREGDALAEFSFRPDQSAVRAVFVRLDRVQRDLERRGQVNTIVISEPGVGGRGPGTGEDATKALADALREVFTLDDVGVVVRAIGPPPVLAIESRRVLVGAPLADAASAVGAARGLRVSPVLTYLANNIRTAEREVPYSLVAALSPADLDALPRSSSVLSPQSSSLPGAQRPAPSEHVPLAPSAQPLVPIFVNEWTARDLGARAGDRVWIDYYVWHESGRLTTHTAEFRVDGVVALEGRGADPDLAPDYHGISESESLADWDPPFPIDLRRIRPIDEEYWDRYRTTPKAFIPLDAGQALWRTRYGQVTSVRLEPPTIQTGGARPQPGGSDLAGFDATMVADLRARLLEAIDPFQVGFALYPARARGLEAARGATDFGEYFLYFSAFLVASALLLAGLFFKLGIEQRLREIGLLHALGFPASRVRSIFLAEGAALAATGSALGIGGAIAYGALIMHGLRTWWIDAVGTDALALHLTPWSLIIGGVAGVLTGLAGIVWTLGVVNRASPRSLIAGVTDTPIGAGAPLAFPTVTTGQIGSRGPFLVFGGKAIRTPRGAGILVHDRRELLLRRSRLAAWLSAALGVALALAATRGWIGQVAGFFGAGTLLLVAALAWQSAWLRQPRPRLLAGHGAWALWRLGARNARQRPGRSILCVALIAFATFVIVAVDAFRRDERTAATNPQSGTGGYALLAQSAIPIHHDPNATDGREALNLARPGEPELEDVAFERFRLRPGDDASCLNLYRPQNPRILAPTADFLGGARFSFQESLAATPEERENPWRLLERTLDAGAVPVVADANSLAYVLHLKVGDELELPRETGPPIRLRVVAALRDSLFQSELLMAEAQFLRLFPEAEGYRFFLIDAPAERLAAVSRTLEERLAPFGLDVQSSAERLAGFHRVENTYLSTFQMLGGLGLILGTLGLGTVLLRNVLERRRELALLRAVGYDASHLAVIVVAENVWLLVAGLVTGIVAALVAIAPALADRGGEAPLWSMGLLPLAVLATGLLASLAATAAAVRSPLLAALRAE